MYRNRSRSPAIKRKLEALRRGRERSALALGPREEHDLPHLRREVTVVDYDAGEPVTHTLRMYKTRRVDTYDIHADGRPWRLGGWTRALEGLRKSYPRVPSPRAAFWR